VAILEADDLVVATATVALSASGSISEESDAVVAAVSVSLSAAVAIIESDDLVSAIVSGVTTATVEVLEQDDLIVGSATAAIVASAAILEESDLVAVRRRSASPRRSRLKAGVVAASFRVRTPRRDPTDDLITAAAGINASASTSRKAKFADARR
jgi:hypothetical protein